MSKMVNLNRLVVNTKSPSKVCVLGFELKETPKSDTAVLRLRVQISAAKHSEPVTGWIDTTGLNFSHFVQFSWSDSQLWLDFWEACSTRVNPAEYEKEERKTSRGPEKARKAKDAEFFKVYQLVGFRVFKQKPRFLVCWQFYPDSDNSEEPLSSLPQMLHTYCWEKQSDWKACCEYYAHTHVPTIAKGRKAVTADDAVARAHPATASRGDGIAARQPDGGPARGGTGTPAKNVQRSKEAEQSTDSGALRAGSPGPQDMGPARRKPSSKAAQAAADADTDIRLQTRQPSHAQPSTSAGLNKAAKPAKRQPHSAANKHTVQQQQDVDLSHPDDNGRLRSLPATADHASTKSGPGGVGPSSTQPPSTNITLQQLQLNMAIVQVGAGAEKPPQTVGVKRKAGLSDAPGSSLHTTHRTKLKSRETSGDTLPPATGAGQFHPPDAAPRASSPVMAADGVVDPAPSQGASGLEPAGTNDQPSVAVKGHGRRSAHASGQTDSSVQGASQHEGVAPCARLGASTEGVVEEAGRGKSPARSGPKPAALTDSGSEDQQPGEGPSSHDTGELPGASNGAGYAYTTDYEEESPGMSSRDKISLHVENACRYFFRRFRDRYPACRKDGYFHFYRKQVVRKGSVDVLDIVERASARMANQLAMDPDVLHQGMDVFILEDPCDPCYNNPYIRGDMTCMQKGCRAGKPYAKGDVVGMYMGRVITKADHNQHAPRDEWELDAPEEAYTMMISWSDAGGVAEHELLLEGDPGGRCPTVFVNHEYYWGECRRCNMGLVCNCQIYKERKANLEVQHGFKIEHGQLTPLTWMAATRDIAVGEVLLTYWDMSHLTEMGNAYVRQKLFDRESRLHAKLAAARAKFEEKGMDPEGPEWGLDLQPLSPLNPDQATTVTTTGGDEMGATGAAAAGNNPPTPLHPRTVMESMAPGTAGDTGGLVSWGVPGVAGPSQPPQPAVAAAAALPATAATAPAANGPAARLPPSPAAAVPAGRNEVGHPKRPRIREVAITTGVSSLRALTLAGNPLPLLSNFHPGSTGASEPAMPLSAPGGGAQEPDPEPPSTAWHGHKQQAIIVRPVAPSNSADPEAMHDAIPPSADMDLMVQEFFVQLKNDSALSTAERTRRTERLQALLASMQERDRMPKGSDSWKRLGEEVTKLMKEMERLFDRQNNKHKRRTVAAGAPAAGTGPGQPGGQDGTGAARRMPNGKLVQPMMGGGSKQQQQQQQHKPRQLVASSASGAAPGRKRSHVESGI